MLILKSVLIRDHPSWNAENDHRSGERNCLAFDKSGHDTSVLVAENCRLRKPFLCMRVGEREDRLIWPRNEFPLEKIVNRYDIRYVHRSICST